MPNGFEGSAEEWRRIEAPLRRLDWRLRLFGLSHLLPLSKNGRGGHEWPERSFRWGRPLSRLIQIYLKDPNTLTHNLWICASEDRNGRRYWKQAMVREGVPIERIASELPGLLETALETVGNWTSADLEATERSVMTFDEFRQP